MSPIELPYDVLLVIRDKCEHTLNMNLVCRKFWKDPSKTVLTNIRENFDFYLSESALKNKETVSKVASLFFNLPEKKLSLKSLRILWNLNDIMLREKVLEHLVHYGELRDLHEFVGDNPWYLQTVASVAAKMGKVHFLVWAQATHEDAWESLIPCVAHHAFSYNRVNVLEFLGTIDWSMKYNGHLCVCGVNNTGSVEALQWAKGHGCPVDLTWFPYPHPMVKDFLESK